MVTINGERCVGLSIYKEPKFNTVDAVKSLDEAFDKLSKALPGYQFIKIEDQGSYISGAIGEVRNTLLIGILLAVFVLYIFLRRIGTTLVISIAIPVSIIATFNLLYFNHLTLNIMTLGGLALGAGMLVDNAIVVLENITRLRNTGMPLMEAIVKGTGEVGSAITASNTDHHSRFSSYCLSSRRIRSSLQGHGMDSSLFTNLFPANSPDGHSYAGIPVFSEN